MAASALHRFEHEGKHYALDTETCFCFETDAISWDVLEHYPHTPTNRIFHLLKDQHPHLELEEVVGELEWLRATGAILPSPSIKDLEKQFAMEPGLKQVTTDWNPSTAPAALDLLLGRSANQSMLALNLRLAAGASAVEVIDFVSDARKRGRLAGKTLQVAVHAPIAVGQQPVEAVLELSGDADVKAALGDFGDAENARLPQLCKLFSESGADVSGFFRVVAGGTGLESVLADLRKAGAQRIDIDLDSAFLTKAPMDLAAVHASLRAIAEQYAKDLLDGRYYRLEPIAGLFHRIYQGTAMPRADGAGVHELAMDAGGGIFASPCWSGNATHQVGDTESGVAVSALAPYENIGARTTAACIGCWARNLCGGGTAAVHEARTGSMREPDPEWCDAQRAWLEAAVATFSKLSASGIDFNRVYQNLGRAAKPSFFQLARAAFRQQIGLRPLAEADAALLKQWGNWNQAAYFTFNESGVLMATEYDREMDSLHPRGFEHEFMMVRKTGAPMGLFKVRPELPPGTASAWLWFHDPRDYEDKGVRRSFRELLKEAAGQQAIRRLMVPVSSFDPGLAEFLAAADFEVAGTQRKALYLHGDYHDVDIHTVTLA